MDEFMDEFAEAVGPFWAEVLGLDAPGVATRALIAIDTITRETGYPPTPDELAGAVGVSTRSLHSALIHPKRDGLVAYDEEGCLVLR